MNIYTDMKPIIVDTLKDYRIHSVCGSSCDPLIHTEDGKIYARRLTNCFGGDLPERKCHFLLLLKVFTASPNCLWLLTEDNMRQVELGENQFCLRVGRGPLLSGALVVDLNVNPKEDISQTPIKKKVAEVDQHQSGKFIRKPMHYLRPPTGSLCEVTDILKNIRI